LNTASIQVPVIIQSTDSIQQQHKIFANSAHNILNFWQNFLLKFM